MISAIDLSKLRNAEYLQFMKNFVALVLSNDPIALNVVAQHAALITKNDELELLFKKELASEITQEIVSLDERRDKAYNGLTIVVEGFSYHYDFLISSAAAKLYTNIKLYGTGVARQNYQAETAIINNLCNDWENKPDLTQAMTDLNLTDWKNELKAANLLFDQRYLARTQEYGAASPETLLAKRAETTQVYYTLRQFIDAFAVTINTPIYDKTTNELNALIAQYNTLLNGRATTASTPPPIEPQP
jgi:hypothetical protein